MLRNLKINCLGCMMLACMLLDLDILNNTAHASDMNRILPCVYDEKMSFSPGLLMLYVVDDLKSFIFIDRFVRFTRRPGDFLLVGWGGAVNIYFLEFIFNARSE